MHIGARHITVSTVGLVPQILRLAEEDLQLNLAVSLMQKGQYDPALTEALNRLKLPDGPGLSAGTVSYLRGICLKALKKLPEARQQLEAASTQTDATLWSHDGPPVAERARRLLVGL